jgi:hypothetical protein
MKMNRNAVLIAASLMMAHTGAYAQFGGLASGLGNTLSNSLGGILGGRTNTVSSNSADITNDVANFGAKSAVLSALTSRSVTAINAAFSSEEEIEQKRAALLAIDQITDPKEKQAKTAALYESESAEAKRRLASGEMEKKISSLDETKKKQIGTALFNFGIGALQASDLTLTGQNLVRKVSFNPLNITKVSPVADALPLLGQVAVDAGGLMVGIMKLARGAKISVPEVTVNSIATEIVV